MTETTIKAKIAVATPPSPATATSRTVRGVTVRLDDASCAALISSGGRGGGGDAYGSGTRCGGGRGFAGTTVWGKKRRRAVTMNIVIHRYEGDDDGKGVDCSSTTTTTKDRGNCGDVAPPCRGGVDAADGRGGGDQDGGDDGEFSSLLSQIGTALGVEPAGSGGGGPVGWKLLLGEWGNTGPSIERPDEIDDGDVVVLSCGKDLRDLSPEGGDRSPGGIGVRLTDVRVLDDDDESDPKCVDDDGSSSSSFIEDVTDLYVKMEEGIVVDVDDDSYISDSGGGGKKDGQRGRKSDGNDECDDRGSDSTESDDDDDESDYSDGESSSSSDVEDVTDRVLDEKTRKANLLTRNAPAVDGDDKNEGGENDDDDECKCRGVGTVKNRRKRKKRKSPKKEAVVPKTRTRGKNAEKKRKVIQSPIEVLMDERDVPSAPGSNRESDGKDEGAGRTHDEREGNRANGDGSQNRSIKQRIIKLLNTGFHDESNEHEARNAMKLARRLMERHNLDQAVLMQERGDGSLNDFSTNGDGDGTSSSTLRGGMVTVQILNRKTRKSPSSLPRWHDRLLMTVCANFCVEAFWTKSRASGWKEGGCSATFYGIRTNAQLAAYAFKISSERIAVMAVSYVPPLGRLATTTCGRGTAAAETRTARLSYALGIVRGLDQDVKEGLQREEERRKAKLARARERAAARAGTGEAYHEESDDLGDDSDNDGCKCEFNPGGEDADVDIVVTKNDGIEKEKKIEEKPAAAVVEQLEKLERENHAQLALVEHHKKVAEDVLKDKNIKLRTGRKQKSLSMNWTAYEKGIEDAKEIDLNQRAIRGKMDGAE